MRSRIRAPVLAGLFASAVLIVGGALTLAQSPGEERPQPDVLRELLSEVRQLRLAVERASLLTPSVQLAVHRVQLQEQRLNHLLQQAREADRELEAASRERAAASSQLAHLQEMLTRVADPDERQELEAQVTALKQVVARQSQSEQDLRQRQAEAQEMLSLEQARWNELNAWLDSMQRQLAAGKPPR